MFQSKVTPGKKFGSSMAGKHYDENHSEDGTHMLGEEESPMKKMGGEPMGEEKLPMSEEKPPMKMGMEPGEPSETEDTDKTVEGEETIPDEVKNDLQTHGAASKVTVTHDHANNRHSVTSQHKDGHVHHSEHATGSSAHASARHLGGVKPPMAKAAPKAAPEQDDDEYSHLLG